MNIVDVAQRSPEWQAWRAQGLSASEAAILMGRSPYKTIWRLWAEKTGLVLEHDLSHNPLVRAGVEEEAKALQRFEEKHEVLLLPVCGESEEYPLLRASFDGLSEANEPVELKCPHETTFLDIALNQERSTAYQVYWCQVQQQILVAGAQRGFLFFYHQGQELEFLIERDEAFLAQLVEQSMDFWSALKSGREPPKDPKRDIYLPTGEAERQWLQLAAEYRSNAQQLEDYQAEVKARETRQTAIEQQFVALMGEYLLAEHSGVRVNRFLSQGAIDYRKALKALLPEIKDEELEIFRKMPATRVRVTVRDDDGQRAEAPFDAEALKEIAGQDCWF